MKTNEEQKDTIISLLDGCTGGTVYFGFLYSSDWNGVCAFLYKLEY
ncbi:MULTISPECIES: hypothetical protein [Hungatella]|nr:MULTISPECIES: hypothetical protein [Hungatella]